MKRFKGFKECPETLGEHLKKRRLKAVLKQDEVARVLRISDASYHSWENDHRMPMVRFMPRIIEWLGYDPYPPPRNSSEWLVAVRRNLGLTRKGLGRLIGADESTVQRWEERIGVPADRLPSLRALYQTRRC
ncbi:MAG: helix-turn-helix domain-containing protein [Geminicoccaceae bacterium]